MERGKGDEACLLFWRENISLRLVALVSLCDSCFNQNRRVDAYYLFDVVFMAPVHLLFACRYLSFVLLV